MENTKYNGWTNYATWRVNLEIFDGFDPFDYFFDGFDRFDYFSDNQSTISEWLPDALKEYAEELISQSAPEGLARDYALSFLSDVNWHEIAEHMIEEYEEA